MNRQIFFWNIMARIGLLTGTAFLLIWLIETQLVEMLFTLVVGILLIVLQVFLLTRYVSGITRVMEQFIQAIGREETPEIQFRSGKALFRKLKERSNAIKQVMNAQRLEKEKDQQILIHVIDSADPGLFCFNSSGEVIFMNQSARKLMGNREPARLEDLKGINRKLYVQLRELRSGTPRVVRLSSLVSIRLKEVKIFDESYRLFSLQDIQEELHKNESDSWQKIIRVLTHEIMNAVSPMLSLSKSLQLKIKQGEGEDRAKILDGLQMIESTGKGLLEFVEEYRRLSLLPPPKKKKFQLKAALERILLMFEDEAAGKGIQLGLSMDDPHTEIYADQQQFDMIMINLVRNSLDAFGIGKKNSSIEIQSQKMDTRVQVQVRDNGQGIAEELLDQVFVPFFSTKEQGSGIGLSLARQIMNNHEGSIHLESEEGLGTGVTLVFN